MNKIDKVYFTSGVNNNVFNSKVFGICRILQDKLNELIEGYNEDRRCYNEIMTNIECLWKELRKGGE